MLGLVGACERESTAPGPPSTEPSAARPASPAPATPAIASSVPASPPAVPSEPAAARGLAQVERVLAEYALVEPFLRPSLHNADPSDLDAKPATVATPTAADREGLRTFLGEARFGEHERLGGDYVRKAWLERMAEQAAREPPSTVRMPLYTRVGFGHPVPGMWVATGDHGLDVTFIMPVGDTSLVEECERCYGREDEAQRERCFADHCNLQVEGHFTGKTVTPSEPRAATGLEFHIERGTSQGREPAPFFLALPGGAEPPDGPPITEGPRWGVLFASAFRHARDGRARADALRARLLAQGHAKAEVLDSRRIPALWCCTWAVLVERFDDEKAAFALVKALWRDGFDDARMLALY